MNINRARDILGLSTKSDLLKSKSQNILNVFTDTITRLESVNEEIAKETSLIEAKLELLNKEKSSMSDTTASNNLIIYRIKTIFSL